MSKSLIILILLLSVSSWSNDLINLIAARNQLMNSQNQAASPWTNNYPYLTGTDKENKNFDIQINEDEYFLGSGDGFSIYLFGTVNKTIKSEIDLEGNAILPSIGSVNLKGKTLKEGKQLLKDKIFKALKKVDVSISLSKVREFKVYLLGDVANAGDFIANGATRVSDIIAKEIKDLHYSTMRTVELQNDDYPGRKVDLALFYHSNIIDQNPYLLEGDRIFIKKNQSVININGAVNYPGQYGFIQNDSLGSILLSAGGVNRYADSLGVIVTRFADDVDSLQYFGLSLKDESSLSFKLKEDDRILVRSIPDFRVHRQITINGEVKYPGVYPIQKDRTKLSSVFKMAGGLTDQAFLKGSKMIRRKHTTVGNKEFERLIKLPPESLSPMEKSYLKSRLTEEDKKVNINFDDLLNAGDDVNDIILRDGDEIHIAHQNLSIKMTGAVINPGLVEYKEGESISYYIKRAGGYSSRARKRSIQVMKAGSEVWLKPKEVDDLEPGDAIWVPDRGYTSGYSVAKEMILVIGSVAALVISAFTIHDFLTE